MSYVCHQQTDIFDAPTEDYHVYYLLYHQSADSLYQLAWLLTNWKEPGYTKFDQSLTKQHTDSILRESLSAHFSLRIGDANVGTSSSSEHTLLYPVRVAHLW